MRTGAAIAAAVAAAVAVVNVATAAVAGQPAPDVIVAVKDKAHFAVMGDWGINPEVCVTERCSGVGRAAACSLRGETG